MTTAIAYKFTATKYGQRIHATTELGQFTMATKTLCGKRAAYSLQGALPVSCDKCKREIEARLVTA